jgi:hypothetical protein
MGNVGLQFIQSFSIPLAEVIWGQKALVYVAMFDIGSAVVIFGICYFLAGYHAAGDAKPKIGAAFGKLAKSIPLLALTATFAIRLLGFDLPEIVTDTVQILSKANTPLSLLLPFDFLFRSILLTGFLLPVATSVIPYSVQFGYDRRLVAAISNISIIISYVLIWVVSILITL